MSKKLIARVCGCYDEAMFKSLKLLRESGFKVSSSPVSGAVAILYHGREEYVGFDSIKEFVENYSLN